MVTWCKKTDVLPYLLCNHCGLVCCMMRWTNKTKRQLSERFGEHWRSTEKALNQHHFNHPTAVSDHFSLPDHSIKDIGIIPLELCNSHRDGIRKAHEGFLISKGETLESYGMNRRDEYGNLFIQIFVYCISPPITFYFYICFILNTVTVYSILT